MVEASGEAEKSPTTTTPTPEDDGPSVPDMEVARLTFHAGCSKLSEERRQAAAATLLEKIKADDMLPYYERLCKPTVGHTGLGWTADAALVAKMKSANDAELVELDAKIDDAQQNLGETEIREALLRKARFYARIGDREQAFASHQVAFDKTIGVGGKLDNILTCIRISLFFDDSKSAKTHIQRAKGVLEKGGDWERRNKLKVYEGVHAMLTRDFGTAAKLFIDATTTFTASELVDFKDFVLYAVITALATQDRGVIKDQVVNSPEIRTVINEIPHLGPFAESFYGCRYQECMTHFVEVIDLVSEDRHLSRHLRFFVRSMRLKCYKQFLAPYKSVTVQAMADAFGVSAAFIDAEVASFVASGRLSCKIDKVSGIIESCVTDPRSAAYKDVVKHGDLLLNRIQKLTKVVDM